MPKTLMVSHIAYISKNIAINKTDNDNSMVISLIPKEIELNQVMVKPINAEKLVKEAYKKGIKNSEKKRDAKLFYRQISKLGDNYYQIVESFLGGDISSSGLDITNINQGRIAKIEKKDSTKKYLSFNNFFYLSSIPVVQKKNCRCHFPNK